MSDVEFRAAFEDGTLPEDLLSHEGHVRMAWIYVRTHPLVEAIDRFCRDLKSYVHGVGATDKYHETITWAFLIIVNERAADPNQSWEDFKEANPDLFDRKNKILMQFYRPDTIASSRARKTFLFPDLMAPLP